VIGIFKQKNAGNTLLLFFYALVLKFPSLFNPSPPVSQPEDHYLYNWLLDFLKPVGFPPFFYSLLAFILLFIQATLFNRICNNQKMFTKMNYLTGMSYLLITSLVPEWNLFAAPLIINTLLIWIFYRMTTLYNANNPNYGVFNIGVLMGIVTLLYKPAIVFVVMLLWTLFIMRPFRIKEWLIALVGVTTPYYFLGVILFLTNRLHWNTLIPLPEFRMPVAPSSILIIVSLIMMMIPFIIGGFYVQNNLNKMLIQVRKSWSLLLLMLVFSLVILLVNGGDRYVNWICCAVPLAAFHAAAYFFPGKKTFPLIMHWVIFLFALYVNYSLMF
jgi:hypothetical protein